MLTQVKEEVLIEGEVIEQTLVDTYILTPSTLVQKFIPNTKIVNEDLQPLVFANNGDYDMFFDESIILCNQNDPVYKYDNSLSVEFMINMEYKWKVFSGGGIECPVKFEGKVVDIMDSSVSVTKLKINWMAAGEAYVNGTGSRVYALDYDNESISNQQLELLMM